jgi:hypothetical protein
LYSNNLRSARQIAEVQRATLDVRESVSVITSTIAEVNAIVAIVAETMEVGLNR